MNHDPNDGNPAKSTLPLEPEVKNRALLLDALEFGYWPDEYDVDEGRDLEEKLKNIRSLNISEVSAGMLTVMTSRTTIATHSP